MSFFTITEQDKRDAKMLFPPLLHAVFFCTVLHFAGAPGWIYAAIVAHAYLAHWLNKPGQP